MYTARRRSVASAGCRRGGYKLGSMKQAPWMWIVLLAALAAVVTLPAFAHAQEGDGDGGQEPGEAFFGTLLFEDQPVAGVRIEVTDLDGNVVGEAVTDADGRWRVALPGPGTYRATLDTDTLPEGIGLRNPDRRTLEVGVTTGRERPLTFLLGERAATGPSLAERIAQASLNGIKLGLIIAMCSVGLSLIFGTTGLINFAHGELVTLGAVTAWYFNANSIEAHLILAAMVAILVCGAGGGLVEAGMLRPLRDRKLGSFQFVVLTIGLSLVVRHLILLTYGGSPNRYTNYTVQSTLEFGPWSMTPRDLWIMGLSLGALVLVALVLQRTRIGKATRAVADNVDLAETAGIDVNRVTLIVWVAGAALAAAGGIFLGTIETVDWLMGFRLLLLMFAAVVLGGLGTAYGAMVGGLVIGVVTEVSTVWFQPEIKSVFALAVLIAVLLLRPQGILGQRERVG